MSDADTSRPTPPVAWLLGAVLMGLAYANRFAQDDAWISFRYARNLVRGEGLVFNPGEYVEGYTNFLWTVLIAAGLALGIEPDVASYGLGLACFAGTLALTWRIGRAWLGQAGGLTAMAVLGTNHTASGYATGGLETSLQTFLGVAVLAILLDRREGGPSAPQLALASTLSAAAVMTRPDAVVLLGTMCLGLLYAGVRGRQGAPTKVAALLVPGAVIVGAWLAWKLQVYGTVVPNTAVAKLGGTTSYARGIRYVVSFFASYMLWAPLLLVPFVARRDPDTAPRPAAVLFGLIALQCLYVVRIGGGFMEFRFLAPIVPMVALLAAWPLTRLSASPLVPVAGLAVLGFFSWFHAKLGTRSPLWSQGDDIESFALLKYHLDDRGDGWMGLGEALHEGVGGTDVAVATTAVGAIGWASDLRLIDQHGLTDAWIARNGTLLGDRPGHQRFAPWTYLKDAEVNLVFGHPARHHGDGPLPATMTTWNHWAKVIEGPEAVPADATLVRIPVADDLVIQGLYLVPHPAVDAAIEAGTWTQVPLIRDEG